MRVSQPRAKPANRGGANSLALTLAHSVILVSLSLSLSIYLFNISGHVNTPCTVEEEKEPLDSLFDTMCSNWSYRNCLVFVMYEENTRKPELLKVIKIKWAQELAKSTTDILKVLQHWNFCTFISFSTNLVRSYDRTTVVQWRSNIYVIIICIYCSAVWFIH